MDALYQGNLSLFLIPHPMARDLPRRMLGHRNFLCFGSLRTELRRVDDFEGHILDYLYCACPYS